METLIANGTIKAIMNEQIISEKFKKREFVITTGGEYPQQVMFEVVNDKCAMLDSFSVGEEVDVAFNLRGREWTNPEGVTKYFNTLSAWSIRKKFDSVETPASTQSTSEKIANMSNDEDDDLPF